MQVVTHVWKSREQQVDQLYTVTMSDTSWATTTPTIFVTAVAALMLHVTTVAVIVRLPGDHAVSHDRAFRKVKTPTQ
jgi:hypothetical protein